MHVSSKKHEENKEKPLMTEKKVEDIRKAMEYNAVNHPKGETLSSTTTLFRVKFVKVFLKSGSPLSRAEYFRELFEEVGYPLLFRTCDNLFFSFSNKNTKAFAKK